jgi:hypothetical protein
MTPIDLILQSLESVQKGSPGQYRAKCPACGGRTKKLSVRETPDGAVLMHCFGGCDVSDVVAAMGLDMDALFPPRERSGKEPKRLAKTLTPGQALELVTDDMMVVAVIAADIAHGKTVSVQDCARVMQAAGRTAAIAREVRHA